MASVTAPTPEPHRPDSSSPPQPAWGYGPATPPPSPADQGATHSAWGAAAPPPEPVDVRRELRDGALCALAVGVTGVLLGLLWLWLAPRVPLLTDGGAVYLKDPEGEEAVGADGVFTLVGLAFGAVSGVVLFLVRRRGGMGLAVGLAVGGLLASLLAWGVGTVLGPEQDLAKAAAEAGKNATFEAPLRLQAKGALLAWPFAAVLVHLLLTAVFVEREDEPGGEAHGQPQPSA